MNIKAQIARLGVTMVATFIVASVVMFLWNIVFHGETVVDWATAVVLAVVTALSLWLVEVWQRKHQART